MINKTKPHRFFSSRNLVLTALTVYLTLFGLPGCGGSPSQESLRDGGPPLDGGPTDASSRDAQSSPDAGEPNTAMPLLKKGTHLSLKITFEILPEPTSTIADGLWDDALEAGMTTGRIHLDWSSVETGPSTFDKEVLRQELQSMKADGLVPFVALYAIDTEGLTVPPDLLDENEPTSLVGGISMDDPLVLDRYKAMLDWAVPLIVEEGGYILSIANEPDGYMEDRPDEVDNVVRFYREAIEHAHTLEPELAITVTLTGAPVDAKKFFHDDVMEVVDVASYNYYCLRLTDKFELRAPLSETVPEDLAKLVEASNGKEVILHELGCPAGWTHRDSVIGSSEAKQHEFFQLALQEIRSTPELRAAYVFQMVDWSQELTDLYVEPLEDEPLPPDFLDSFKEWLETSGFITYYEGRIRSAWAVFLEQIEAEAASR